MVTELTIMFGAGIHESCQRELPGPGGAILIDVFRYLLAQRFQLTLKLLLYVLEAPAETVER